MNEKETKIENGWEGKTYRNTTIALLIMLAIGVMFMACLFPSPPEAVGANSRITQAQWSPRIYTNKITMVTEETNVATPFGWHLNVNWGYAPIHVVQGDLQVVGKSPGHTEYSIGQGLTFEFDASHEVRPVMLLCTYTELKPGTY